MAFLSAGLLGCYDSFKKKALRGNAVIPVLFLNTVFSSLLFLPFILLSSFSDCLNSSLFYVVSVGWDVHKYVMLKSLIVLSSWLFGYFAMKHLPLTIVGPINATRPVLVLLGALLFWGEHLNVWQWIGVLLSIFSFFLLSHSGRKEGIDFKHNKWIFCVILAAIFGALSGLYDKYLMGSVLEGGLGLNCMYVQSWYNVYQCGMMGVMLMLFWIPYRCKTTSFHWDWTIIGISVFLSAADFLYFYSLSLEGSMISIVSMIRRGSVVVSFLFGALFFHEKNLRSKAVDLGLVLMGLLFLYIGSK